MKKILFVGEHPLAFTGNGGMMNAILSSIDRKRFEVVCYAAETDSIDPVVLANTRLPYTIIPAGVRGDIWGTRKLLDVVKRMDFHVLAMIGVDVWRYSDILFELKMVANARGFKWMSIFPYDLQMVRPDWLRFINMVDYPYVYSQYGKALLEGYVPNIQYFRPPLHPYKLFKRYSEKEKKELRKQIFPAASNDLFIFGFVGKNQQRKDPLRLIKAFSLLKRKVPNVSLYLHTDVDRGMFNLRQYCMDVGLGDGDVRGKPQGTVYKNEQMTQIYALMDCLVNCTQQEGLSYTPIESMLCGTPVILSDSTAQKEIGVEGNLVPCNELNYLPIKGGVGSVHVETKSCKPEDMALLMEKVATNEEFRRDLTERCYKKAREWQSGISNINKVLMDITKDAAVVMKKERVILFVQHSSAGDVLMTTRCFKGLKERHPGMPLWYMTQSKFHDILIDNPYIDRILDWDEGSISKYEVVYTPHSKRILRGNWNTLDVRLCDLYHLICEVEPENPMVNPVNPEIPLPEEYVVVNSAGASPYRIYGRMGEVVNDWDVPIVQIGAVTDPICKGAIDLRGKLSYRNSAWVMKNALAAICIDSFCSHLAGAVNTPSVVLFGPAPPRTTAPHYVDSGDAIFIVPNLIKVCPQLGHCSGVPRVQCKNPCINTIEPLEINKALNSLLSRCYE
jgi:glycosyltransferase involved in cell wall biosynthesis